MIYRARLSPLPSAYRTFTLKRSTENGNGGDYWSLGAQTAFSFFFYLLISRSHASEIVFAPHQCRRHSSPLSSLVFDAVKKDKTADSSPPSQHRGRFSSA